MLLRFLSYLDIRKISEDKIIIYLQKCVDETLESFHQFSFSVYFFL